MRKKIDLSGNSMFFMSEIFIINFLYGKGKIYSLYKLLYRQNQADFNIQ